MAWVKIDDNAPQHKKLLRVVPAARWLWVCGLAYCQRLRTNGHIPTAALMLFGVEKPKPLAEALVVAKLWHRDDEDGYRVHDFLDWNDSSEERDQKTSDKAERQRKWRASRSRRRRDVDASTSDGVDAAPTPTPLPTPLPLPTPHPPPSGGVDARGASPASPAVEVRPPGLVMSPAEFDRRMRRCAFVGQRLEVPRDAHVDFVRGLGGEAPDAALRAWYADLDEELVETGEAVPDVWSWLRGRFKPWAQKRAGASAMAAFVAEGR